MVYAGNALFLRFRNEAEVVAGALSISEPSVRGRLREGAKLYQNSLTRLGVIPTMRSAVLCRAGAKGGEAPLRLLKKLKEMVMMS